MQTSGFVNGPQRQTDWDSVKWRKAERIVRNLRQRIFRATQANDHRRVRSLQKLMLRSYGRDSPPALHEPLIAKGLRRAEWTKGACGARTSG
jgi:N-terminal domain of reverse transcriptase